jgi:two-component system sensor kinase FixL
MMEDFNRRFRLHDWAGTPLGKRENWPLQLSTISDFMLEISQPAFVLWGCEKNILFNKAFAEILGGRAIEALGISRPDLRGEIWAIADPFVISANAGSSGVAEDIPFRASTNGLASTHYYSLAYSPLRDFEGHVVGSFILCTDTTTKVMAMRRLEMERDAIFRLFTEAPGFIAMLAGPEHRFVFANPSYLRVVGRTDVVGQTVREALPEVVEQGFAAIFDEVYATGERFVANRMPVELGDVSNGERQLRYVSFVFEPMRDEDVAVIGIFIEGHDVTEEVVAQERVQLLQSELIHLSRVSAMETMASTLAHELNQPLTAVKNYVTGCQRILERGEDCAQIGPALSEIGKSAARAGQIISSLREMTRRGDVKREPFNPDEAIKAAVALAEIGICGALEVECRFAGGQKAAGDPVQIQQVLLNLIRNACEAAQGVDGARVVVAAKATLKHIVMSVEDNGPGIAPENLSSLFDAFFSTKAEGMGVGLSISRTIVEGHGGRLWAENVPEGGARFSFTLPLAETTAADPRRPA